jgi:propionyl-CoA carboxylase beta chain
LAASSDPEATRKELAESYRQLFASPYKAAELGFVDQVIRPEDTRSFVCRSLEMLRDKRQENPRRKHGNIPL